MAKNTHRYTVHKWIDIPYRTVPESLISKLEGLETYKDQVLKEHLYGTSLVDEFQEEGIVINAEEIEDILTDIDYARDMLERAKIAIENDNII